jgi:small nuclear ribonucleoprotein (snRNP)-like protein
MTFPLLFYITSTTIKEEIRPICECLNHRVLVHLKDGRLFCGILYITDNRGHLVLQGDVIWTKSSKEIDMQWMGMVSIAPEHILKIERQK